jgi:hypothetical protein
VTKRTPKKYPGLPVNDSVRREILSGMLGPTHAQWEAMRAAASRFNVGEAPRAARRLEKLVRVQQRAMERYQLRHPCAATHECPTKNEVAEALSQYESLRAELERT